MKLSGRHKEISILESLLKKEQPEFVAIYGRRRVGKTFLIREVYKEQIVFECAGLHEKNFKQQLENFWLALLEYTNDVKSNTLPKTWLQAFAQLKSYLRGLKGKEKKVIFLDEISWFETPRSGFLAALDNFWNQFCSKREDIILVICGSAASWIIKKVINNRGGLHNRITTHLKLEAFSLSETKAFLSLNKVQLTLKDITQLYMCIGGIPFYLKDVKAGKSIPQILDDLFFVPQATLKNEFSNLYAALFKNHELHEIIVAALSTKNKGLTRSELIKATKIPSGGGLTDALKELIECGFVKLIYPINKKNTDALYRLIDEYTIFYFRFLANNKTNTSWVKMTNKSSYKIWSGYAFENLCIKHSYFIKKALGISGVITNEYSWVQKGTKQIKGAQIDFIIDRDDNCINLLELKYHEAEFEIGKQYATALREKVQIFKKATGTKKNIFLTILTIYGTKVNDYYISIITNQLIIEDLFVS